jgi:hypothetical protein
MKLNANKLLVVLLAVLGLFLLILVGGDRLQNRECVNTGVNYKTPMGQDYLELVADPRANSFVQGETVTLLVTNKSNLTVWFPKEGHIKIYLLNSCGEMVAELKDLINTTYAREMVLEPGGGVYSLGAIDIFPEPVPQQDEVVLYILVTGYEYKDGQPTERDVKAGISVTLYR